MQQTSTCNRSPRHTEKTPWEPRGFGRAFGQKVLLQRHRTEGWGKNNQTKEGKEGWGENNQLGDHF